MLRPRPATSVLAARVLRKRPRLPLAERFGACVAQTIEVEDTPYNAELLRDGNRAFYFPPTFECMVLSNIQAFDARQSRQDAEGSTSSVTSCTECNNRAISEKSSIPPYCFSPEKGANRFDAWWPSYDELVPRIQNPHVYTVVLDLKETVTVGKVDVVLAANTGQTPQIESVKVCFAADAATFSAQWIQTYGSGWVDWRDNIDPGLGDSPHLEIEAISDSCVDVVGGAAEGDVVLDAAAAMKARVLVSGEPEVRYVLLQIRQPQPDDPNNFINQHPIVEKIDVFPPDLVSTWFQPLPSLDAASGVMLRLSCSLRSRLLRLLEAL